MLQDQLVYPRVVSEVDASELTAEKIRAVLDKVDLGYLVDREGALTEEINWEAELSLGEKQQIAIARLVFNRPKFAILVGL